jgi:O-antigen/teichoic acid export membrane protein
MELRQQTEPAAREGARRSGRAFSRALVLYGLGTLATAGVSIVLVPAYARVLGPSGYGLVETLTALIGIGAGLSIVGLDAAVALMLHRGGPRSQASALLTASGVAVSVGLAGAIVLVLAARPLAELVLGGPQHAPLVGITGGCVLASGLFTVWQTAARNLHRPGQFVAAAIVYAAVAVAAGLSLVVAVGAGAVGALLALLAGWVAALAAAGWGFRDLIPVGRFRSARAAVLLRVGLPLVPAVAAQWSIHVSDRFLLAGLAGLSDVGLYGAAAKLALVANLLVAPFIMAWSPLALSLHGRPGARQLYADALAAFAVVGVAVTVVAAMLAEPALVLLAGDEFRAAYPVVWVLVAGVFVDGAFGMLSIATLVARRTELVAVTSVVAAGVNLVANVLLIPPFGFLGAGVATLTAYLASAIGLWLVAQRVYPIPYTAGFVIAATGLGLAGAAWIALGGLTGLQMLLVATAVIAASTALGGRRLLHVVRALRRSQPISGDDAAM